MYHRDPFSLFVESRQPGLRNAGFAIHIGLLKKYVVEWQELSAEEMEMWKERSRLYNETVDKEQFVMELAQFWPSKFTRDGKGSMEGAEQYVFSHEEFRTHQTNRNIVKGIFEKTLNWKRQPIVVCSFTTYLEPPKGIKYLPAEIGLSTFSLKDGVIDNYARIISPGLIPKGRGIEAYQMNAKLGLPEFGQIRELMDFQPLMITLARYLYKHKGKLDDNYLYVFCFDSEYLPVSRCFEALFEKSQYRLPVKVLSLDLYVYLASGSAKANDVKASVSEQMVFMREADSAFGEPGISITGCQEIASSNYGVFKKEAHVEKIVRLMEKYNYIKELCCVYHIQSGKEIHNCALNKSNRYAFYMLAILFLSNRMKVAPGNHYPNIDNPEEEKARRFSMLKRWGLTKMEKAMVKVEQQPTPVSPKKEVKPTFTLKNFGKRNREYHFGRPLLVRKGKSQNRGANNNGPQGSLRYKNGGSGNKLRFQRAESVTSVFCHPESGPVNPGPSPSIKRTKRTYVREQ